MEVSGVTLGATSEPLAAAPFPGERRPSFPRALADLFDAAPFGVIATDADGIVVYVNGRQCEYAALPRDFFLGRHRRAAFGPALERSGLLAPSDELERGGTPFEVSAPRYRRQSDGAAMSLSLRGYRYQGYNLFFTSLDKALADQVSRYEQLFENANDGIFTISRDGRFLAVNQAFATLVGMPREEIIGQTTELFLPGQFGQSLARIERIIREGRFGPYELEIATPIGRKVVSLNAFRFMEGEVPAGVVNIARDVTEQRLAERALRRESSFVRLLKDVAIAANRASTMEEALRTALEKVCTVTQWPVGHVYTFDCQARELVPTEIWHFAEPTRFEPFRRVTESTRCASGDGFPGRVLATATPIWVADVTKDDSFPRLKAASGVGLRAAFAFPVLVGTEVAAVLEFFAEADLEPDLLLLDVVGNIGTQLGRVIEREKAQRDLAAARDHALRSARMKSSFLASMSHEIRTPLNGVIGMTGLLLDTKLEAEQREYAETIRSCADTLLGLINDILDFSKIEAGKLVIEPIPFDLAAAAQEVVELLAAKSDEKGLDLVLRYAPDTPDRLIGDPGRVRQVLTNLVNNAVKFTEKGQVLVDIACERREGNTAWIRFTVQDSGIGIPSEKQQQIFERFTQAEASTTRKYGGTGLGLAISKQLVELMGGSIGVRSRVGEGSTFWFVLPLPVDPNEQQGGAVATADLANVRMLIVDDNAINRRVLHELVTRWGLRNGGFASAADALAELRSAHASGDPYRMAIVDSQMPDMDGETLGRAIKSDPNLRDTVLLLLTSSGERGDARRATECGFAARLTKPVRPSVLMDALLTAWCERKKRSEALRIARRRPEAAQAKLAATGAPLAGPRVLMVEDNVVNQKVTRLILERLGCRIDAAANGKEAVEMVQRASYDIVFMDCQMPVMDGYEATRQIRRQEKPGQHVAIIAMTAHAMQGDRERCLEAGMDDYTTKPIRRDIVESALQKWTSRGSEPPPRPSSAAELKASLESLRQDGGDEFVADLVGSFLANTRLKLASLREPTASRDFPRIRAIAHELKGSSAMLGATALAKAFAELESKAAATPPESVTLERAEAELASAELMMAAYMTRHPGAATSS